MIKEIATFVFELKVLKLCENCGPLNDNLKQATSFRKAGEYDNCHACMERGK